RFGGVAIFSADARLATRIGGDAPNWTVQIFESATGKTVQQLPGQARYPIAFSPNSRRLATVGLDAARNGTLRAWDVTGGTRLCELSAWNLSPQVAFSPDGQFLYTGAGNNPVQQLDVTTGQAVKEYANQRAPRSGGPVGVMAVSPGGRRLVVT